MLERCATVLLDDGKKVPLTDKLKNQILEQVKAYGTGACGRCEVRCMLLISSPLGGRSLT